MAIMQSCCCFSNVRDGSIACGIYSLVTSCICLAVWSLNLAHTVNAFTDYSGPAVDGIYAAYSINIILTAYLLIASIILILGVILPNKTMLIPYMVGIVVLVVLQAIAWVILFILVVIGAGVPPIVLIVSLVFWLLYNALNITCLLCVISQYQELSEGRGRAMVA